MRSVAGIFFAAALAGLVVAGPAAAASRGAQLAHMPRLKADRVVVVKSERRLLLLRGEHVIRAYRVALGRYPQGPKIREGDARTPEGRYLLDDKIPDSNFYRAIHISYPGPRDLARADALGVSPGGRIMIHGLPNKMSARRVGHPVIDWTQGCIAVTNREMDEIWRLVEIGTPIEIQP